MSAYGNMAVLCVGQIVRDHANAGDEPIVEEEFQSGVVAVCETILQLLHWGSRREASFAFGQVIVDVDNPSTVEKVHLRAQLLW